METPQSIREVRFRQALRGYHPEDVDSFINRVTETVEELQRRVDSLTERAATAEAKASEESDVEDSLRRTLVLAQRTADVAVREAKDEAARILADAQAEREVMAASAEAEIRESCARLRDERDALARDVETMTSYLERERERLRIYFTDQLQRVEAGVPGVEAAPPMEAPPRAESLAAATSTSTSKDDDDEDEVPAAAPASVSDGAADGEDTAPAPAEDDPFLAELRLAVTDTEPLGPRDQEDPYVPQRAGGDVDIFEEADSGGRFLRRRR